eukprot:CAMPEP_0202866456 /NCGR_PEP_ID=MMETSP1391-20130828/7591_1 /ASSEMBLY_ACC=CAM_ASM_000867 /TAXON_ID=1034604 /ORGANISM="Chlamydomonas leiostraca, Strain SAG 11-49" /LENGTH=334 /DNA_ID=CAMNT_0049546399 /DNA_START=194 /DNA_END=1198 /DNA_ORIENTATION=+
MVHLRQPASARALREDGFDPYNPSASLQGHPPVQRAGAEHGQAFQSMLPTGRTSYVDVDKLNDMMRYTGAQRLRNVCAPDQAFGLIFNLDALADTRAAMAAAWKRLAAAHALPCPDNTLHLVEKDLSPERAIMDVLGWTRDMRLARGLVHELSDHFAAALMEQPPTAGAPGLRQWLDSVATYHIPTAAVTRLDRATARRVLERMTLHDHFQALVTDDDGMETQAEALLSAALQLQRPPNHCVFFDSHPQGVTAAHNASMKCIALASARVPAYKLRAADLTCTSLASLSVYNVRRLFANAGCEMGDLVKQSSGDKPGNKKRIANAVFDPENCDDE